MGNLRKRNGFWYVDLRANGRRFRKKIGKSKRVAELALKDYEVKAERNQIGFLERKEITIDAFLDEFLRHSETNNRSATTIRYRSVLRNFRTFLKTQPEANKLHQIDAGLLDQYKQFRKTVPMSKNGKPLEMVKKGSIKKGAKSYTVNFELSSIRTALGLAVKWGYLEKNPASGIKQLKPEDSKERRFLTEGECERLLAHASPEYYPIFFTFLHTGMRKGELVNLQWRDVDFARKVIQIRRKSFWVPKTGERELPMSEEVLRVLNGLPKRGEFVFTNKKGHKLLPNSVRYELVRTAERAQIPSLTEVHALRHTFASHMLMSGVDLPTVQKLMGHTRIETTMVYTHQTTDHLKEAMEKLHLAPKEDNKVVRIG